MFRFIHAADLHLDSPLRGLERYEGAPVEEIRGATRRAFDKLVAIAIERQVELVVLAGDLYDGDWRDYNTGLYFVKRLNELRAAGIRVCLISGNHDAQSQITRQLRLPDNVKQFSTDEPESHLFEDLGCWVHGQGFATRVITDDLSAAYPHAKTGYYNIGLLHTCLDGKPGHDEYAPCSVDGLKSKGYDYWALGHVHKREVVWENPWIVFPGNIQGRHIREEGPKGCTLVTVDDNHATTLEEVHLDVLRWQRCTADILDCQTIDEVHDRVRDVLDEAVQNAEGRPSALRLSLRGETALHGQLHRQREAMEAEWQSIANEFGAPGIWLQKTELATRSLADAAERASRDAALDDLLDFIRTLRDDGQTRDLMHGEIDSLLKALPREAREEGWPNIDDPDFRSRLLDDVAGLLTDQLGRPEAD